MRNFQNNKNVYKLFFMFFVALCSFFISVFWNSGEFGFRKMFDAFWMHSSGSVLRYIVWNIRVPRALLGFFVGGGLAVSGCVFQTLLRNPMAEPFTLGVSGGGALGIAVAVFLGLKGFFLLGFGLAGGILTIVFVYLIAFFKEFSSNALILSGIAANYVFSSSVLLLIGFSEDDGLRSALMWLMGDVSFAPYENVFFASFGIVFLCVLIFIYSFELDVMSLGDEKAQSVGVKVDSIRKILFVFASLIAGICVAVSGIVGFVGLMIPHFARKYLSSRHIYLIPGSFLAGSVFFVLCDTVSKNAVSPRQIPVGIITGFIGGIFFIILALKEKLKGV